MKNLIIFFPVFFVLISACIPNYNLQIKNIPEFPDPSLENGVVIRNAQVERKNPSRRIVRLEKKGIALAPVWIQNNTYDTIYVQPADMELFAQDDTISVLSYKSYLRKAKYPIIDKIGLTALGIPLLFKYMGVAGIVTVSFELISPGWFLIIGAPYYLYKAVLANKALEDEIEQYKISREPIEPGKIQFGVIPVKRSDSTQIFFRYSVQ